MKRLEDILVGLNYEVIQGDVTCWISSLTTDSRQVADQGLFIAIEGHSSDGHKYIQEAIAKGASAIVISKVTSSMYSGVTILKVENTRRVAAIAADHFYGQPSLGLPVIGVTGTNGKTSVTFLCHQLLSLLGVSSGLISTIGIKIGHEFRPTTLTTPGPVELQKTLAEMRGEGCSAAFMEVSSHAIEQERIKGIKYQVAVFTNISHDHLDYHGTFSAYIKAKKKLFDHLPKDGIALINSDDKHGQIMVQNTRAIIKTFALQSPSDYKAKILSNESTGLQMLIDGAEVFVQLVGKFNASNIIAVYAIARLLGFEKQQILEKISQLKPPPGRFERIISADGRITGLVDYAHTPDALEKVLHTIVQIKKPKDRVITVVGCGGNRDKAKRPKMALIACRHSDRVILTSDNPRDEDPLAIIGEMEKGVPTGYVNKVISIADRAEAIKTACLLSDGPALILVAGKGHENYQEIKGKRIPFDDVQQLKKCLN